jgi:hypothetical protein
VITTVEPFTTSNGEDHWELAWRGFGDEHPWNCLINTTEGIDPQVGDLIQFWGKGFGHSFRGVAINGKVVFYRTAEEQRTRDERNLAKYDQARREEYAKKKESFDFRIAALPEPFRDRIAGFRERNPDFGWQHESYELMVCEDAVKIAITLETRDAIIAWSELPYEEQKTVVPITDGHSGNSFGQAVFLARWFVKEPGIIPKMHGALCPLVGCKDYGCYATVRQEGGDAE